jgi:hypothetical protein
MKRFIAQKEERCSNYECELPKGSNVYIGEYEDVLCEDCFDESERNYRGETYG